jgi:subtilisin family serine protease
VIRSIQPRFDLCFGSASMKPRSFKKYSQMSKFSVSVDYPCRNFVLGRLVSSLFAVGLLASCGGNGDTSTAPVAIQQVVRPATGVDTTTITNDMIVIGKSSMPFLRGQVVLTLNNPEDWDGFSKWLEGKRWSVIFFSENLNSYTIQTDAADETALKQSILELKSLPYVGTATKNFVLYQKTNAISADPSWLDPSKTWNLEAIDLAGARQLIGASPGFGVGVGVIDSKFELTHPDVQPRSIAGGRSGVNCAGIPPGSIPSGVRGSISRFGTHDDHGTHVLGIIGAKENTIGLLGIAPNSTFDVSDPFNCGVTTTQSLLASVRDVVSRRVINLSLGYQLLDSNQVPNVTKTDVEQSMTEQAEAFVTQIVPILRFRDSTTGTLLIQSSGNEGDKTFKAADGTSSSDRIFAEHNGYLATVLGIQFQDANLRSLQDYLKDRSMVVGATAPSGGRQAITSYTMVPSLLSNQILKDSFILAPGGDQNNSVYSTLLTNSGTTPYGGLIGTSMAAPHVTGVAALVMQRNNALHARDVKKVLLKTSTSVSGYGFLNAAKAVQSAVQTGFAGLDIDPTTTILGGTTAFTLRTDPNTAPAQKVEISVTNGIWTTAHELANGMRDSNGIFQTEIYQFPIINTFSAAGTYDVYVRMTDLLGRQSVTNKQVTITSPNIASQPPVITDFQLRSVTAGNLTTFTITGTNLPSTPLNVTFNGCANISFLSQTATQHTLTCTPQPGSLAVSIRATANMPVLASYLVASTAASVVCVAPQLLQAGVCINPSTGGKLTLTDTGTGILGCYQAGVAGIVNCASSDAIALNDKQDGMTGLDFENPDSSDGYLGFKYTKVSSVGIALPNTSLNWDCVKDEITGLLWENKNIIGSNPLHLRDASKRYFSDTSGMPGSAEEFVSQVNSINLCGYSDWRIPSLLELQTLVNFSQNNDRFRGIPLIDQNYFENTSSDYWMSSSRSNYSGDTRLLFLAAQRLYDGTDLELGSNRGSAGSPLYVRLVRGGNQPKSASSRFVPSTDGSEITDDHTGLIWQRCLIGQTWSGVACQGAASRLTHEQALARAVVSVGWRLPNVKERVSAFINHGDDGIGVANYECQWTSTPYYLFSSYAYCIQSRGQGAQSVVNFKDRNTSLSVRLVRIR